MAPTLLPDPPSTTAATNSIEVATSNFWLLTKPT